jgi:hypothetical protein
MISPIDIQITKVDLSLYSTVLVVSKLVDTQLEETNIFNKSWINLAIATLFGVAFHGLLTNKISYMINKSLKVNNINMKHFVYNLIKYGTIFISQKVFISFNNNIDLVFDKKWIITYFLTICTYTIFNLCKPFVPKFGKYQHLLNDIIMISMCVFIVNYFVESTINKYQLLNLYYLLCGVIVFHLFIKPLVVPKKKIKILGSFSTIPYLI